MGEKKEIRISVKDKIACLVDKEQFLVCGNNDYEVLFDFDSDWEGINAKTAVFVYGNTPIHQPFVGNVCEGVEIKNATLCAIGVFAGNIKTTTGATIECKPSIRDLGGVPKPPSKEVYDEIMALLDKAIEAHTELPTGGKKGQVLKKVSDKDYDTAWENDEQRDLTEIEESLANKLNKTTEANKIYGTDANGVQIELPYSQNLYANGIVRRDAYSNIFVPESPLNSVYSATSKGYVDKKHNEIKTQTEALEERVSDLESLTLTFTEDKTVAYNKSVPANVGKYALIKSIGGATKKVVVSKNILNPRDIEIQGGAEDIVYNEDGSITLTIPYNSIIVAVLPQLPTKTYGMYAYSDYDDFLVAFNTENGVEYGLKGWNTLDSTHNSVYLELGNMDWNGEGEEVFPPVRVTFKVAIFEDTTEQPYEPFREGFINAEVTSIDSIGADGQTLIDTFTIPVEAINARVGGYGLGFIGQWDRQFYNRVFFENGKAFFENPCVKEVYNGADSEGWKARTEKCSYHCPLSTTAVDGVSVEYENITSIGSTTGVYLNSTAWLIVTDLRFPTLEEFKAHLSKNPLTVLWAKKTYGVTDITDLFPKGNKIEVQQGGTLIPVNANEMPVPTTIAYVTRKG
jgi:hypothetical protein